MAETVKTTCPYCGVGCGIEVTKSDEGQITVQGDPDHPANFGKLCSKGSALDETLALQGRLLKPKINGEVVTPDHAVKTIAQKFQKIIQDHGPDSVAFYVSGQLLTEDYYVANKLIKGFIGTANIDTNSRLCMSSSVAGHKRAFGSDTVPQTYDDIEQADLVVLTGSNLAWCHPVLFQRLKMAKSDRGTKVIVIDPRKTATCEIADMHLALEPGSDVMLFNGLLAHLYEHGKMDDDYIKQHVDGCKDALDTALKDAQNLDHVADICGLDVQELHDFYNLVCNTEKTLTIYSQGVNQSSQGTEKVNAILNTHLFSGRIGKVGCGPLSVTGQPNAMGGREVGGLANMLAAHMDFTEENIERVRTFWDAPHMATQPGQKAVDMFEALHRGDIKAIWIMATNPAVSLPDTNRVREALKKCDCVIVSEAIEKTDTTQYGDILLPAATWGERNGTVTNTERRISRQRPFTGLPGQALPDWHWITKVAQAMGYEKEFPYSTSFDVFAEHVSLSAHENNGKRDFDLSGWLGITRDEFDAIEPTLWPVGKFAKERFFAKGGFYTPNHKAKMLPITHSLPKNPISSDYPFILNTGRVRDQWHTMTRSGLSPRLNNHIFEPYLEIHPEAAIKEGLHDQDLVAVSSKWGACVVRVKLDTGVKINELFMPMHWTDQISSNGNVGRIVNPETDPFSGQPESKHTPVKIKKFKPLWHGLLISRTEINCSDFSYWTKRISKGCFVYYLAGSIKPSSWEDMIKKQLGDGDIISVQDQKHGHDRFALIKDNRASGLFIKSTSRKNIPNIDWVTTLFEQQGLDPQERMSLLSARPAGTHQDKGPIVCSCFSVGLLQILDLLNESENATVEWVGEMLKAGTNCGSCQSEIKDIIASDQKNVGT